MSKNPNLGDFLKDNKQLLRDYLDLRLEILRLQLVKMFARTAGYLIWTIVSLFILLLFLIFLFLVIGFLLSELTGNIITGFVVTTVIILVVGVVITLLRRILFVNPIIKKTIKQMEKKETSNENKTDRVL